MGWGELCLLTPGPALGSRLPLLPGGLLWGVPPPPPLSWVLLTCPGRLVVEG